MKTLLLITGLLIGIGSWGNENIRIMFHGTVSACDSEALIEGKRPASFRMADAQITVTCDGQLVHEQFSSSNGAFAMILEPNNQYMIHVRQAGYLTRSLTIDTHLIPPSTELKVYKIYGDVIMMSTPERLSDEHFMGLHMAKGEYNPENLRLEWDNDHARRVFEVFLSALKGEDGLATSAP